MAKPMSQLRREERAALSFQMPRTVPSARLSMPFSPAGLSSIATCIIGLTREMLRPMLKAWLDDNLPAIVERLVSAEIERVARGE